MDFALLVSSGLLQNPNSPPAVFLDGEVTIIGRHSSVKMDTSRTHEISKKHAEIRHETQGPRLEWVIEDNKSLNGTFVNCRKVKKQNLNNGDEIVFGGGSCFVYGDQITSSDNAECRYIFVIPDKNLVFHSNCNNGIVLNSTEDCEECCICYTPMAIETKLPCGHSFCRSCLSKWGKQCLKKEQPFVCPICRKEYDPSMAKKPTIISENNQLYIMDVEPLLRKLNLFSLKEVEKLSIFNKWTAQDKDNFWNYNNLLENSNKKLKIFRAVTDANYYAIKQANNQQLLNAIDNLNGDKNTKYLKEEVANKVAYLIYHLKYIKPSERRYH